MKTTEQYIEIRPHNVAELARMYEVSIPTFRKWLLPHQPAGGKRHGTH